MPRDEGRGGSSARGGRDSGGRPGSRYEYKARTADQTKARATQTGGAFDSFIKQDYKTYTPPTGDNLVRTLPPTWENPEHFGLDAHVHYGIGPDNSSYLCLEKMKGEPCPICEERARAEKSGDTEYAAKLKVSKRVLVWVIDRNQVKEGPMIWSMAWTMDRDICKIAVDKSTGEVLQIDNPQEGYDLEFERKGTGLKTEYIGIAIARRSTELGDDRWLDYVVAHPLPDALQYYDYAHLLRVFQGGSRESPKEGSDRGGRESSGRGRTEDREPDYTWDSIHKMTFDEMSGLIDAKGLKIDPQKSKDDEDLADWVCEDMGIAREEPAAAPVGRRAIAPQPDAPPAAEPSHRERLRGMRA